MFCYQCEQAAQGTGCTTNGVCGKTNETAIMQDLLVLATKGLAQVARLARAHGVEDVEVNRFTLEALFTTVTNVNFDADKIDALVAHAVTLRDRLAGQLKGRGVDLAGLPASATFSLHQDKDGRLVQALDASFLKREKVQSPINVGLEELILYGLKGVAAYADHAMIVGQEDPAVYAKMHEILAFLETTPTTDELVAQAMAVGELNLTVMGLLDAGNTGSFGHPVPTKVNVNPVAGKCILVSGHDLRDLEALLKQTAGKGINIYTHGEMLPAHGYPVLKAHPHLVGNYGGAWQDQKKEFDAFPGAILMTTNCIQKPAQSYVDRIFTTGLVAFPGVAHVPDREDFGPVIEKALALPGFAADEPVHEILVGFGHQAVMNVAGPVIEAVKAGKIRHFFLVGGCDGAKPGRNYYTDFTVQAPKDTVILTLACGKYRFNKLDFGDIGGIPRLLDVGQCNDAYSAIQIAVALANAFGTDVNSLPLSLVLSWYEQKAVCILLTLLHLGIRNMRLGPTIPAFLKPEVVAFLHENFNLMPITTPEADLKAILG
ncbi:MAG: hydroxylamine reductase [Deltaproteobacteria bacterium HGW-Deltaproteobacteria-17]|nr:MAG: hydroxylamine reductase [Deltaproteobacteria bacterium HGW-Deltaproteobacteria-17]